MSNKTNTLFKFDEFCLDTNQRCLMYQEKMVSLTPKAYQTLLVLLRHHGEIVEKDFLLNEVWADTFVEETTLAQNILTLRKTLSRFVGNKEFIVTFPRRGYRFVAEVQEIVADEEIMLVEKQTRTRIIAQLIHDSDKSNVGNIIVKSERNLPVSRFASTKPATFGLLMMLILSIIYLVSTGFSESRSLAETQFQKIRTDSIVADADIKNAIVSPSGSYLAFVQVKTGIKSLNLRQIENGNSVELVANISGTFIGAVFSPDSQYVFYTVIQNLEPNKPPNSTLYKISVFGGASQEILRDIESPVAVSSDQKQLAFIRRVNDETALIVADINGKNEKVSAVRKSETGFTNGGVSWSPDGKLLSASVYQAENNQITVQLAVVNVESGEQKIISREDWIWAGQSVWLKDGSGIVVAACGAKSPGLNDEIWIISYPQGKSRLLTNGINGVYGLSLNTENDSIVAVKSNKFACFLTASVDNLFKNTHVLTTISDESSLPFGADWTNDGRIIYSATEDGNADIYTISEDGSERKQITSGESAEISPKLSADGRFLIFMSNRSGQMNVWRSDANGTNTIQITESGNVKDAIISPNGNSVFYLAKEPNKSFETLWQTSINGERATQMTKQPTLSPRISPDGKSIACSILNAETNKMMPAILSAESGEVIKYIETPQNNELPFLDWSKDGESLFVVLRQEKPYSLWKLSLTGEQPEKLREWENDAIFRLAISKNGERVFYEVGNELNSVVQLKSL
jgi:Tol biopolymer transport system component/DNA-binding winged helix-turn-helix (wHTH) protein